VVAVAVSRYVRFLVGVAAVVTVVVAAAAAAAAAAVARRVLFTLLVLYCLPAVL